MTPTFAQELNVILGAASVLATLSPIFVRWLAMDRRFGRWEHLPRIVEAKRKLVSIKENNLEIVGSEAMSRVEQYIDEIDTELLFPSWSVWHRAFFILIAVEVFVLFNYNRQVVSGLTTIAQTSAWTSGILEGVLSFPFSWTLFLVAAVFACVFIIYALYKRGWPNIRSHVAHNIAMFAVFNAIFVGVVLVGFAILRATDPFVNWW